MAERGTARAGPGPRRPDAGHARTTSGTSTRTATVCAVRSDPTSAGPTLATRSTRSRGVQASIDINNRHRILRRGREYGNLLSPDQAVNNAPDGSTRGLYFACVNANIGRQFEFIQRTWVNNPKFNGLYDDRDPLVASESGGSFTIPGLPVRNRLTGLPSFVTVTGGAYFFLPGIRAVRYLAALPQ